LSSHTQKVDPSTNMCINQQNLANPHRLKKMSVCLITNDHVCILVLITFTTYYIPWTSSELRSISKYRTLKHLFWMSLPPKVLTRCGCWKETQPVFIYHITKIMRIQLHRALGKQHHIDTKIHICCKSITRGV
jgi:hypothetical protein